MNKSPDGKIKLTYAIVNELKIEIPFQEFLISTTHQVLHIIKEFQLLKHDIGVIFIPNADGDVMDIQADIIGPGNNQT